MSDLNNVSLTGRLTKDAERKVFPNSGTVYAQFDIANNTGFGQYSKTSYFKCKMIGKGAEAVLPYLKKGQLIGVTGTLESNDWTNQSGQNVKDWLLTTTSVQLLGGKRDSEQPDLGFAKRGYEDGVTYTLDQKLKAQADARAKDPYGKNKTPVDSNYPDDIPF